MRLRDQKQYDQAAENHRLQMRQQRGGHVNPQPAGQLIQQQRQDDDEGRAQEAAEQDPIPPMMIMNSRLRLRVTLNASGSQAPRWTNPHSAPATPA